MKKELPEGWSMVELGAVCKLKNGFAFKSSHYQDEGIPVIRISDIKYGYVKPDNSVKVDHSKDYENYLISENDILVAMSGATTGKFGVFKSTERACQNQRVGKFQILNNEILNNDFLLYQLHSLKRRIEKDAYGGAQPNISSGKIEAMQIFLPPLPAQQAIVSKIEELFSELDKGIENLKTAQAQLKVYRQSVLKWAFEGKLTSLKSDSLDLPDEHDLAMVADPQEVYGSEKCQGSSINNGAEKEKLLKDWKYKRLGDMFNFIGGGTPSKSELSYWNGNIPWTSVKDVKGDYLLKTQDTITEIGLKNSASNLAEIGDVILITRISPGKAIITNIETAINQDLKIAKPKFTTTSKFVKYFFNAIERECIKISSGTTVLGITLNNLNEILIPELDLAEQTQIVQEIESRLSVADKMEETIQQSLLQAESLRQSILKKAFEGGLVK